MKIPAVRPTGVGAKLVAIVSAVLAAVFGNTLAADFPFEHVADVPLGGHPTRLDYESIDPDRHLLFIAHLGDSEVIVFDLVAEKVVTRIADVSHVHGVLAIPALGKVYASATGSDEVVTIDETTLKIVARMPGGTYPDGMAYAPDVRKLYVSDENGNADTVIDVASDKRVATIPLDGEVGNTQYDSVTGHIFANVQTRGQLAEIDTHADKVIRRIGLPGAKGNHGLLIDPKRHRAFIACEGNGKLLVLNLDTRKIENSFEVGAGPDVLANDPGLDTLYVAAESGTVAQFAIGSDPVTKIAEGLVGPNAHVVAVDASTHRIYFPLKDVSGRPMLRIADPKR